MTNLHNSEQEIWQDIPGSNSEYQVSTLGRIKSLNFRRSYIYKDTPQYNGYITVKAVYNGIQRYYRLHRLIALVFIPNPLNKPFINHKNGIRHDNRVVNLEWCTHAENISHGYRIGLIKPHSAWHGAFNRKEMSRPIIQMDLNCNEIRKWPSAAEAKRQLGLRNGASISGCLRGKANTAHGFVWKYDI